MDCGFSGGGWGGTAGWVILTRPLAELFWRCFAGSGQYNIKPRMISGAFACPGAEWLGEAPTLSQKARKRYARLHWE